jgi:ABC-2 type transport system permease protein
LEARVRRQEIDAFLWLSPTVVAGGPVTLWARNPAGEAAEQIRAAVTEAVQRHRLTAAGIDPAEVARLLAPVRFETLQVTRQGTRTVGPALALAFLLTFVLYFLTLTYGMQAMQSAQEERTNRIAEILATSVRPSRLLLGKVLGVAGAALVQIGAWLAMGWVAFRLIDAWRGSLLPVPPGFLAELRAALLQPMALGFVAFALVGFLLYSTLFAALGATTDTPEEAQRFFWVLFLPLVIPMVLQGALLQDPAGPLAQVLTWVPLTAPLLVPFRLALDAIPTGQAAASFAWTALAVAGLAWVAGKIYRIGILSTGQSLTWRNLRQWLRAA